VVHKTDHKGAIIGGAIGGAALLVIFFTIVFCCRRRSRGQKQTEVIAWNGGSVEAASNHSCCNPGAHGHGHGAPKPQMSQVQSQGNSVKRSRSTASSRSSGSRKGKRPPPLQLESLVTPVIAGPVHKKDPFNDPNYVIPTPDFGKPNPFRDSRNPGFSIAGRPVSTMPAK